MSDVEASSRSPRDEESRDKKALSRSRSRSRSPRRSRSRSRSPEKNGDTNGDADKNSRKERSRSRSRSPKGKSRSRSRSRSRDKGSKRKGRSFSRSRSRSNGRRGRSRSRSRSPRARSEPNKVYIGNLSFRTRERDLEEEFRHYGRISDVYIPTDRNTGRSKGFGFVTFEDPRDAVDAIEEMDNRDVDGRKIRCNIAHEPRSGVYGNTGGGGGGGDRHGGGGRGGGGGETCRDYQRGNCSRGQSCRYSHD